MGRGLGGSRLTPVNSPLCRIANCCHHVLMSLLLRAGAEPHASETGYLDPVIRKNFQCLNMYTSLFSSKVSKAHSSQLPALPSHHLLLRNQEENSPSHLHHTQLFPCSHLVLLLTLLLLWLPASVIWTSCWRLEPRKNRVAFSVTTAPPQPKERRLSVQSLLTSLCDHSLFPFDGR